MTRPNPFTQDSPVTKALLEWHEKLNKNRGDRAALRRAASPEAVAQLPAFIDFLMDTDKNWQSRWTPAEAERLAAIAGLAAHVKEVIHNDWQGTDSLHLARQMAGYGQDFPVSLVRFRRILEQEEIPQLYGALLRVIRILDGKVHLRDLAHSVFGWGPEVRKKWAYDYYPKALEKNKKKDQGDSNS